MNLDWETIRQISIGGKDVTCNVPTDAPAGRLYALQRAEITHNGAFWSEWRAAKAAEAEAKSLNAETPARSLNSVISLSREPDKRWFAWRLYPIETPRRGVQTPCQGVSTYGAFPLAYTVKDVYGLLPYQPKAVALLCNSIVCNGAAADSSDTGIGKTYHAISSCRNLHMTPAIVCRKAGISTWIRVCKRLQVRPLFVVNWEYAKSGKLQYARKVRHPVSGRIFFAWNLPQNTLLIFDEAHMGSIEGSQNNALWISSKGKASISLSATFADRPSRLKSLFHILGAIDPRRFDRWLLEQGHFINQKEKIESVSDLADMKFLNKVLFPRYGCRISYDDRAVAHHFPSAVYQTEIVYIGNKEQKEQNEIYEAMMKKAAWYKERGRNAEALNADLRYRQEAELLKVEALCDLAGDFREQGRSVCIFVNYRETLKFLAKKFDTKSCIFGGQERYGIDREKVIDDFQNERESILLAMVQAGGQSISLHDIHGVRPRISLICPTYDPIVLKQVFGRIHRAGSRSKPIIKLVYAANTVEEKVAERVSLKLDSIAALNDGDLMTPDMFNLFHTYGRK